MKELIQEIRKFLPIELEINSPEINFYNEFVNLAEHNSIDKCERFSFVASHMLFMCFLITALWQIIYAKGKSFDWVNAFKSALFLSKEETYIMKNMFNNNNEALIRLPKNFSNINEKKICGFFSTIDMPDQDIKDMKEMVDDRNNALHANCEVSVPTISDLQDKIKKYLNCLTNINLYMQDEVEKLYIMFLEDNYDGYEIGNETVAYYTIKDYFINYYKISQRQLGIICSISKDKLSSKFDIIMKEDIENMHMALISFYQYLLEV